MLFIMNETRMTINIFPFVEIKKRTLFDEIPSFTTISKEKNILIYNNQCLSTTYKLLNVIVALNI